jgi:hypothetical protein
LECGDEKHAPAFVEQPFYFDIFKHMEIDNKFIIQGGFCHVTADQIILTRDEFIGNVLKETDDSNVIRNLIITIAVILGIVYFVYQYTKGNKIATLVFGLMGLYLIYGAIKTRNYSGASVIDRKEIKCVSFNSGIPGWTRPSIVIKFNDNGQLKTRVIVLHMSYPGGVNHIDLAEQLMSEEKVC